MKRTTKKLARHRVTPFLWYDGQAEEAARHYVSVFEAGSRVVSISPMSVTFELEGLRWVVNVARVDAAPALLTCSALQAQPSVVWRAGAVRSA